MNRKQKILTVVGVIAIGFWAFLLSDGNKLDASMAGGLFFIVACYIGLFFVLKK